MVIRFSEEGIKDAIQSLVLLKSNIVDVAAEDIVAELVTKGESIASAYDSVAPKSGVEPNAITSDYSDGVGRITMYGPNAVYDEFGTGEEGAGSPHPLKDYFNLNPYNSGPYIFYNQLTNRYQWAYKPMAGRPYFTEKGLTSGIPAGKQMYNTAMDIRKIKDSVIEKHLNGAIKKFK